ncbi:MAG: tryptophan--tRNA ligase [Calditrichaeota bacterium]|nr:MAG: tryptophan--tRNA ligase [Calditrichota bacterium]MBL1206579.1 tryptophan--tRNA ligase [Calditrichota bacterium]NOG46406.1 tryptophan--tRNA ligase [Calditrichota bacterium]
MSREVVLTGITTTGTPHLGNYVGAIRPAIEASHNENVLSYYFLADYHALIKNQNPKLLQQSTFEIAATWLACGLDPEKVVFYRQSDIPEIMELTWMLTCMSAKGLMNRSHAYKAMIQANEENGKTDLEEGVTMGLFCYPILMAADILMFKANKVPVGKDQIQHIEMARDLAQRFNHHYGELLILPESVIDKKSSVLTGLDGRKMSKSYNNTIPLFLPEKKLRKMINKIITNSLEPGEPKDADSSSVFQIYQAFASEEEAKEMRKKFEEGIAWGAAKQELFEYINEQIKNYREEYTRLMDNPDYVQKVLMQGAEKARDVSVPYIKQLRDAIGFMPISKIGN